MTSKKISQFTEDESAFLDSRTKDLALSYPHELDAIFKRIASWSPRPIEIILQGFENEALALLKRKSLPTDRADLWTLLQEEDLDLEGESAARIVLSASTLRDAIQNGEAELAAVEMLKISFAALALNLHEVVIRGIRAKAAPSKGGRVPKIRPNILEATVKLLEAKPSLSAMEAWRTFGRTKPLRVGDSEIYFHKDLGGAGEDRLVEDNGFNTFSIGYEAFRKNYFAPARKKLGRK